jgi:hypothetical protein
MQSVIFGWLFHGYGLGLFGKLGVAAALAVGNGIYVLQVAFGTYWSQRYLWARWNGSGAGRYMEHGNRSGHPRASAAINSRN